MSYLWNDKIRGHRRDRSDKIPDIASVVQTNPVQTTQAKYTGIKGGLVFESNFSVMDGLTNYTYQPDTAPGAVRIIDTVLAEVDNASTREEHQPNSRHQFDNVFTFGKSGLGGEHLFKAGVQWGRLYHGSDYSVRGDHWLVYQNRVPTAVRQFNSPLFSKNEAKVTGIFFQDSWSMNRLRLNIGARYDNYVGSLPDQSATGGTFGTPRTVTEQEVLDHSIAVWRAGASYDLTGSGRTALKASYSRYGLQVGIDRVTAVNPLTVTYSVSRAVATANGVALTRASQTVVLSERGDERYGNVTMFDVRLSRAFLVHCRMTDCQFSDCCVNWRMSIA